MSGFQCTGLPFESTEWDGQGKRKCVSRCRPWNSCRCADLHSIFHFYSDPDSPYTEDSKRVVETSGDITGRGRPATCRKRLLRPTLQRTTSHCTGPRDHCRWSSLTVCLVALVLSRGDGGTSHPPTPSTPVSRCRLTHGLLL